MSFKHHAREITERRDPMQEFADRIVEQLEQGGQTFLTLRLCQRNHFIENLCSRKRFL
jgi:hypothetical protein